MKTTSRNFTALVRSSKAGDLVWVTAYVTIKDEPESNYLAITQMLGLIVEGDYVLTPLELEDFNKRILDQYRTHRESLI